MGCTRTDEIDTAKYFGFSTGVPLLLCLAPSFLDTRAWDTWAVIDQAENLISSARDTKHCSCLVSKCDAIQWLTTPRVLPTQYYLTLHKHLVAKNRRGRIRLPILPTQIHRATPCLNGFV